MLEALLSWGKNAKAASFDGSMFILLQREWGGDGQGSSRVVVGAMVVEGRARLWQAFLSLASHTIMWKGSRGCGWYAQIYWWPFSRYVTKPLFHLSITFRSCCITWVISLRSIISEASVWVALSRLKNPILSWSASVGLKKHNHIKIEPDPKWLQILQDLVCILSILLETLC